MWKFLSEDDNEFGDLEEDDEPERMSNELVTVASESSGSVSYEALPARDENKHLDVVISEHKRDDIVVLSKSNTVREALNFGKGRLLGCRFYRDNGIISFKNIKVFDGKVFVSTNCTCLQKHLNRCVLDEQFEGVASLYFSCDPCSCYNEW